MEAEIARRAGRVGATVPHVAGTCVDELRLRLDVQELAQRRQDVEQRPARASGDVVRVAALCAAGAAAAARLASTTSEM